LKYIGIIRGKKILIVDDGPDLHAGVGYDFSTVCPLSPGPYEMSLPCCMPELRPNYKFIGIQKSSSRGKNYAIQDRC